MKHSESIFTKKGCEVNVSVREKGTVRWFNASQCFGHIARDQGEDIYVGYDSFRDQDSRFLITGSRVEFIVVNSAKGLQIRDLIVIS
jgi:CspA family cold shock protein